MGFLSHSLRGRFALAFLASALVPLAVFAAVNYARTSAGLVAVENRLVQASTAAVAGGVAQQQAAAVEPFTLSPPFVDAVASGDRKYLKAAAWNILESRNLVQVEVRGLDGRVLARASVLPSPRRLAVGSGDHSFASYLGKLWVINSVPVAAAGRDGDRVGVVVAATQVDDAVLHAVSQQSASPAYIYVGGELAAAGGDSSGTRDTKQPAGSGARHSAGGWMTSFSALRDAGGRTVGVLSVAIPDSAFATIRSSMRTTSELALALALAAALVGALVLSNRVTRPLRSLSSAAEAIASGEMRQHIPVKGEDEIAVMARAFNSMSERVAETVDELADQIRRLARGLADLSLVGETLAQSHDAKAELVAVAERVQAMTRSDFCGIHLLEEEHLLEGIYAGTVNGSMLAVEELARWTAAADGVATSADLSHDERVSAGAARAATGISSVMVVPVVHQGRTVGAISVGCARTYEYSPSTEALLTTVASQVATALRHAETFRELEASYLQTVVALTAALEAKDEYTANHAEEIARMAVKVGRRLGLTGQELRRVEYMALLHDVGKIGISPEILAKAGALSAAERAAVNEHTKIGERIVARIDYLRPLAPLIRAAHERWDGEGYPDQLAGEDIPLEARIAFVCDAFDAMTSDRPYRARLSDAMARAELRANAGKQFDPSVVGAFLEVCPRGRRESPDREAAPLEEA